MLNDILNNKQISPAEKETLKGMEAELSETRILLKQLQAKVTSLEEQAESGRTVLTRPEFNREVARMLAFDERYGGQSSVLYYDFASLSELGARAGNAAAADAIRSVIDVLTHHVRGSDIIGRLATDEFGVLLVRCNNENAWKKGRELAALLATALDTVGNKKSGIEVRFGAYTFREDENVASGLKEAAASLTKIEKP